MERMIPFRISPSSIWRSIICCASLSNFSGVSLFRIPFTDLRTFARSSVVMPATQGLLALASTSVAALPAPAFLPQSGSSFPSLPLPLAPSSIAAPRLARQLSSSDPVGMQTISLSASCSARGAPLLPSLNCRRNSRVYCTRGLSGSYGSSAAGAGLVSPSREAPPRPNLLPPPGRREKARPVPPGRSEIVSMPYHRQLRDEFCSNALFDMGLRGAVSSQVLGPAAQGPELLSLRCGEAASNRLT
mmetsp:Transcript_8003/g.29589  ORF Transcript_8003/g.29589 Transcript_8003/m.29589 type:complete len:245 (+) Transcript_8003:1676-2410(+)